MTVDVSRAPELRGPAPASPPRRPGSVRRTSSIDMSWPEGRAAGLALVGRARDLYTPPHGYGPVVLAADEIRARVDGNRAIQRIETTPPRAQADLLVGARAGGHLRRALAETMPDELAAATPLYLLLDDLSGATLVSQFAYSQWPSLWPPGATDPRGVASAGRSVAGVCIGFQPGSSALGPDGRSLFIHDIRPVGRLNDAADPYGWHEFVETNEVASRRARRIDVFVTGNVIEFDSMFQDSMTVETGGRIAVHEYGVSGSVDVTAGTLCTITAEPRVLPYRECPLAANELDRIIGLPLADFRMAIPSVLRGTLGCTHLNDVLRALSDVPTLARKATESTTQYLEGR